MTELKPCPFCGGNAKAYADPDAIRDSENRLWAFRVTCDKCAATTGVTFSPEKSWDAWNRRTSEDTVCGAWKSCWNDLKGRRADR